VRLHGPPRLLFEPLQLLKFDFYGDPYQDPDRGHHSNPDPDPASKNNADPDQQPSPLSIIFFVQALVQLVKDDLKDLDTMLKGLAAVEQ
jgi:hypothetical protein